MKEIILLSIMSISILVGDYYLTIKPLIDTLDCIK